MDQNGHIRIAVADGHRIVRDGLRKLLDGEPGFQVIGEASEGPEVPKLARETKPDILLLDLALPRQSGLEVLRELHSSSVATRTLLLVATIEKLQLIEALQFGAWGVVTKESPAQLLFKGIRAVVCGQYWLGREHIASLVEALRDLAGGGNGKPHHKKFQLTPRELQIVERIVAGCSNREIAQEFALSEVTVKHHLSSIFPKLGVSNRLELALFAIDAHLVSGGVAPDRRSKQRLGGPPLRAPQVLPLPSAVVAE